MSNDQKSSELRARLGRASQSLQAMLAGRDVETQKLKASKAELASVKRAQQDIESFRKLTARLKTATDRQIEARMRVDQVNQEIVAASGTPLWKIVAERPAALASASAAQARQSETRRQLDAVAARLGRQGIAPNRGLAAQSRRLDTRAGTLQQDTGTRQKASDEKRDKRTADLKDRAENMKGAGEALSSVGRTIVGKPLEAAMNAEASQNQLKASLMRPDGTVPPVFEKMNLLAEQFGAKLPGSANAFREMMSTLVEEGTQPAEVLDGVGAAVSKLSLAIGKTPAEAAKLATSLRQATNSSAKDLVALSDVAQRALHSGLDDKDLTAGFDKLAPAMRKLGLEGSRGAQALTPLLMIAKQSGDLDGKAAGAGYAKMLSTVTRTDKVGRANRLLDPAMKLDFTDGKGGFGGVEKMAAQLGKLKALSDEKREAVLAQLFGRDDTTRKAASALIDAGPTGYRENADKLAAGPGMQQRADLQTNTLGNAREALMDRGTEALSIAGAAIAPDAQATLQFLSDIVGKITEWMRANPELTASLMRVAAVLGGVMAAGGGLLMMVGSILGPIAMLRGALGGLSLFGPLIGLFRGVAVAIGLVGRVALANPLMLLVTVAALIITHWDVVQRVFAGAVEWIKKAAHYVGKLFGIGGDDADDKTKPLPGDVGAALKNPSTLARLANQPAAPGLFDASGQLAPVTAPAAGAPLDPARFGGRSASAGPLAAPGLPDASAHLAPVTAPAAGAPFDPASFGGRRASAGPLAAPTLPTLPAATPLPPAAQPAGAGPRASAWAPAAAPLPAPLAPVAPLRLGQSDAFAPAAAPLAFDTRAPLGVPTPGKTVNVAGDTYNITLTANSGPAGDELLRMVRAELARGEELKRTRVVSSFSDALA
ncbi:phage tail tape measure protein [Burkholderia sp. FERM BP-3421]|uniref:phage tail tape measure protein n=1 Tax=Burkholderia sp. FERM BP-3421 TaxID=1494466 RepID=UPI0023617F2F|nr:phage tail tape measure protein [Burkholderia sp. FERM BP-3421]WDD95921.1 phage tail tape measure protein [Burkholderia sp. FERM BP-3421]